MLANQDMFLPEEVTILSPEKLELSPQLYWIYLESELLYWVILKPYFGAELECAPKIPWVPCVIFLPLHSVTTVISSDNTE